MSNRTKYVSSEAVYSCANTLYFIKNVNIYICQRRGFMLSEKWL